MLEKKNEPKKFLTVSTNADHAAAFTSLVTLK